MHWGQHNEANELRTTNWGQQNDHDGDDDDDDDDENDDDDDVDDKYWDDESSDLSKFLEHVRRSLMAQVESTREAEYVRCPQVIQWVQLIEDTELRPKG